MDDAVEEEGEDKFEDREDWEREDVKEFRLRLWIRELSPGYSSSSQPSLKVDNTWTTLTSSKAAEFRRKDFVSSSLLLFWFPLPAAVRKHCHIPNPRPMFLRSESFEGQTMF